LIKIPLDKKEKTALLSSEPSEAMSYQFKIICRSRTKPATPLQWCSLADVGAVGKKIKKIVNAFGREKQFKVIHDVPKWNYVQALLSLGDRRVGEILLAVHRLEGNWVQALKEVNINADFYVYRQKKFDEIMPWILLIWAPPKSHLSATVKKHWKGNDNEPL
jgi:hypothetical protein